MQVELQPSDLADDVGIVRRSRDGEWPGPRLRPHEIERGINCARSDPGIDRRLDDLRMRAAETGPRGQRDEVDQQFFLDRRGLEDDRSTRRGALAKAIPIVNDLNTRRIASDPSEHRPAGVVDGAGGNPVREDRARRIIALP